MRFRITRPSWKPLVGFLFIIAGSPTVFAQIDGFKSYQLLIFCGEPSRPTAQFWYNVPDDGNKGRPLMGLHTACAGKCDGKQVTLEQALSRLPSHASTALRAKVAQYQADAAAGEGLPLDCLGKCGGQAWKDYERKLKVVFGLWADADAEFDRGLAEFHEAAKNIRGDMVEWPRDELAEEFLPIAIEHLIKKSGRLRVLIKPIGGEGANVGAAGFGVVTAAIEIAMVSENARVTINNLDYSAESENKMRQKAMEKWAEALEELERALAQEKACADANAKAIAELEAKAKAERRLEEQARQYLQENYDNFHRTYRVGGKEYKDADAAFDAAKKLIEAHYKRRSGYVTPESVFRNAAYFAEAPYIQTAPGAYDQLHEAVQQLTLAEGHLRRGTPLIVAGLKVYRSTRQDLDAIRSRMGTGAGPATKVQATPAPK